MTGVLVAREKLTQGQRGRMFEILDGSFQGITWERFMADLGEKNWVILILDEEGKIVGFSTLLLYQTTFEGEKVAVVYSGDTIIERGAWGSAALPRTWIRSVWELHGRECAELPLYWLLLTSGFRTYRFLSVFWREFFPSCRGEMPARMERLRSQLARERFKELYDEAIGVVRLGQPLREELLAIPAAKMGDADVAFFAERNPGYVAGDELVCVCELSRGNLTGAGRRMVDGV